MPLYLVERVFPDGFPITASEGGHAACIRIAALNAELGVTWLHSYVADGGRTCFCLYDAPSPEAVRRAAARNSWPADAVTQVSVLDPHFHLRSRARRQTGGEPGAGRACP